MRFEIKLIFQEAKVPIDYKRKILSLFKQVMNEQLREEVYGEHKMRNFTFSPYMKVKKISKQHIELESREIKVFLSIDGAKKSLIFLNSFRQAKSKKYSFGSGSVEVLGIKSLNEKKVKEETVIFKTMSPIAIREKLKSGKDWYHELNESGIEVLKKNIAHQLRYEFPRGLLEELEIDPIKTRRTVTTNYNVRFPVTFGTFVMKGNKRILETLYKRGLGSRTSMGYGMLEILD